MLTVDAFNRELRGEFPLHEVKALKDGEANRVIPNRIKNTTIYERLQQALDNDRGLEDNDNDPLAEMAEIIAGLTGFESTAAYTDEELADMFSAVLDDA